MMMGVIVEFVGNSTPPNDIQSFWSEASFPVRLPRSLVALFVLVVITLCALFFFLMRVVYFLTKRGCRGGGVRGTNPMEPLMIQIGGQTSARTRAATFFFFPGRFQWQMTVRQLAWTEQSSWPGVSLLCLFFFFLKKKGKQHISPR